MKHLIILFFSVLLLNSCKQEPKENTNENNKIKIVTTTGMLADVTEAIVEDKAEVISLMGPGVDPHLYKATQGDLRLLKEADIIIYNGLHLEGKMGEVFEKMERFPNKIVLAAAGEIPEEDLLLLSEDMHDPHIWFDLKLWSQVTDPIATAIGKFDPENKSLYKTNADTKKAAILKQHNWVIEKIQELPKDKRILITAHDAFSYFGRAYDMEVIGLQGISTLSEAGVKDVSNLVNLIVDKNIKAVFIESSVPKKALEAVVEGVESRGHQVSIGGMLYSDAMGEKGTKEGTYEGMVEHNVTTIVEALK